MGTKHSAPSKGTSKADKAGGAKAAAPVQAPAKQNAAGNRRYNKPVSLDSLGVPVGQNLSVGPRRPWGEIRCALRGGYVSQVLVKLVIVRLGALAWGDETTLSCIPNLVANPIHQTGEDIWITGGASEIGSKYYVERAELGHGHYGTVRRCRNKETDEWLAVKRILKKKVCPGKTKTLGSVRAEYGTLLVCYPCRPPTTQPRITNALHLHAHLRCRASTV